MAFRELRIKTSLSAYVSPTKGIALETMEKGDGESPPCTPPLRILAVPWPREEGLGGLWFVPLTGDLAAVGLHSSGGAGQHGGSLTCCAAKSGLPEHASAPAASHAERFP